MRILFIVRTLGYGGASKQLALLANALSNFGHEVSIYVYCAKDIEQVLNSTVSVSFADNVPQNKIVEYLRSVACIRREIKRIQPNVVVSWRCNAGCLTKIASLGLRVKTIFSERTDPFTETSFFLKISSFVCGFSDGGVFQLESVRKYYGRLYHKSVVIPNPIEYAGELNEIIPYEKRPLRIAFVGRTVISQKRQDVAIEAFEFFLKKHPDFELHIYGDGCDQNKVKEMTSRKGLIDKVVFHGSEKNITEKICNSKVLLLTSDYEGIPNVILEAFVAGVPVVSTNCSPGGAKFLIGNDECGRLAPVQNPLVLSQKMTEIVENVELAKKCIFNGRCRLHDFLPENIYKNWENYLKTIM